MNKLALVIAAALLVACGQEAESTDYTPIGNNIKRTMDNELGIACYSRNSGQFSCVAIPRDK